MNIISCFGSSRNKRPSTSAGASRRPPNFDPTKGAKTVKVGSFPPPARLAPIRKTSITSGSFPPPDTAASPPPARPAPIRKSSITSGSLPPPDTAASPPPARPAPIRKGSITSTASPGSSSGTQEKGGGSNWPTAQQQHHPPDPAAAAEPSEKREEISQDQYRRRHNHDNMRRPSAVASGSDGQASDPFACTHLTELMPIQPMESTYRAQSGGLLPDGIEAPSGGQNMRRLYVHDEDRVLLKVVHYGNPTSVGIEFDEVGDWQFKPLWTQRAGPRAQIYFNPSQVKAAIVTCGGLCPGLNDVIRQVVLTLEIYGVKEILGIQYGFKGFVDPKYPPVALNRKFVSRVHMAGGSFLGVSRGTPDLNDIVDKLQDWGINFFFVIGGNGSHAGAHEIYKRCLERKMRIAVVGIPKTIDNDLQLVDKTFGFDTSVEEAQRAINAAFVESRHFLEKWKEFLSQIKRRDASSAYNGVGIVKLMGRQSGFISMYATLASGLVDIVLIPEVPFVLEGEHGVYNFMKKRLDKNGLCVVVIAEGAGQDLLDSTGGVDASGNPILGDIGKWFYSQVKAYFGKIKMSVDAKYIDPTYMIRARPCNSSDHILCSILGQHAVHGAFAGYTDITIGLVNTHYVFLPIPKVIETARKVDPNSNMWHRTLTATGQPDFPVPPVKMSGREKEPAQPTSPKSQSSSPRSQLASSTSQFGGSSRSVSPGGESLHSGEGSHRSHRSQGGSRPRRRVSQLSIRIDKNHVKIKSVENFFSKN